MPNVGISDFVRMLRLKIRVLISMCLNQCVRVRIRDLTLSKSSSEESGFYSYLVFEGGKGKKREIWRTVKYKEGQSSAF